MRARGAQTVRPHGSTDEPWLLSNRGEQQGRLVWNSVGYREAGRQALENVRGFLSPPTTLAAATSCFLYFYKKAGKAHARFHHSTLSPHLSIPELITQFRCQRARRARETFEKVNLQPVQFFKRLQSNAAKAYRVVVRCRRSGLQAVTGLDSYISYRITLQHKNEGD